jgi:hypothetical protein
LGIFSDIMDKIFHHPAAQPAEAAPAPAPEPVAAEAAPAAAPGPAPAPAPQPVDVEAVLTEIADEKGDDAGNWETSIVDLLKLLDLDSSLAARAKLADELDIHEGENGSAEENVALIKGVWKALADNGGKVPDKLKAA